MENNYRFYEVNGKRYKISEAQSSEFEKDFPSAKVNMAANGKKYLIDVNQRDEFLNDFGDGASYTNFDEQEEPAPKRDSLSSVLTSVNDSLMRAQHGANKTFADSNMETVTSTPVNETSWGESFVKGAGAGFTRAGKGLLDALTILSSNNVYVDPMSANPIQMLKTGKGPELVKTPDYDTLMREKEDPMIKASLKMGEVADRLSKEADPTHGEKGFVDLIIEGKIGTALQKGLATGAESLPMTLSAYNPYTMALNVVSMAGANYAEETLNNPEVDKWKRATQAIGSAALEQAVEKFADPIFKYIGGGKMAGEFTEAAAREILQDVTGEATESIAKRILNVLSNTAEDALSEGGEEIMTSFGNDILGEALDLLDGDKDYGIRAQWEKMKEENPDANMLDFAESKAKEYLDSFIGGALSGAYMSGTTQSIAEGVQYSSDMKSINAMNAARELGASMNYGDMYDVDSDVNDAKAAIAESFVNETGGAILSSEFIDGLSSEDAFALSRSEGVSAEQRKALATYAIEKAKQESLNKKLDENLENNISIARARIEVVTENGQVISGMYNGRVVYVTGATVSNGAVTLPNGENGPILVVDSTTGDKMTVRSEDISSASAIDSEKLISDVETFFRTSEAQNRDTARNTMSVRAKHKAILPYAGKKILIDLGNGTTEVFVQNISNNGDVVIKGKKGDLGGQSILTIGSDVFYDSIYHDSDGNPVVTEAGAQETEPAPETEVPQTPVETDFRDFTDVIIINGKPIKVDEVTSQDDVADSITYRYTDENGVQRTGNMTIGSFAEAVNLGRQQTETPAPAPTAEGETGVPPAEQTTETPTPEPAPVPTEQTEQAPVNWETMLDFEPENYLAEMQNRYGDKTVKMLNAVLSATQRQLDKLNKATPEAHEEILQNEVKKDILQARIDKLGEMVARLSTPVTPEVPSDTAPVAETPVGEEPAPSPEIPAEPASEPTPAPVAEVPEAPTEPAPVPDVPETPEPVPVPTPSPRPASAPAYDSSSDKAGSGFARMVKSFKAQINKLIKKVEVKDFVGTDNTRPVMTGVYRANGYEYASDSMILVKVKAQYPAEQEGKIISTKTGQEISGKYPNADVVIESSIDGTSKLSDNIDDIIAYAQTLEEIKKGMVKDAKLYIKVGNSIFESTRLLTAAKMAKKHGLTNILQKGEANKAMVFEGVNGVVLVMPTNNTMVSENIIDIAGGQAEFGYNALYHLKTPTTLKGIEAARTTLEAVLPRLGLTIKEEAKAFGELQYVNGNVVWRFDKNDIAKAKGKANDPNTYAALEEIEKNGMVVPMSLNDAEAIFPELFVSEPTPVPDAPVVETPVAPNPVSNPIDEARKKERQLATNLKKIGLSPEHKQDLAYNAGKAIADMFATREEYDAYAESATDFGQYNADFERGVDDSFAARNQQNIGNPPVNSVPLENEPNGENNGEQQPTSNEPTTEGRGSDTTGGGTNDGGNQEGGEGTQKTKSPRRSKGKKSGEQVEDKYPARKGNATQKLLVDTFGFESVTIPNARKEILNTIYDFMMEMSKTLGISPKSIGQGGWLNVRNKPTSRKAIASHELTSNIWTGEITDVSLRFKYSRLSSIAHEWWHSLDRALSYFETGKKTDTATQISETAFTGRKETWDAVQAIMKALNDSGYTDRIRNLVKGETPKTQAYFLSPTEQAARAFDEYITMRFAEAGITIENYDNHRDITQPTAEEMKVIAPAIENLFKVLKEKEGKKQGTSVLYHIGFEVEQMAEEQQISEEAIDLSNEVIDISLEGANIDVERASDEKTKEVLALGGLENEFSVGGNNPIFISNAALAVQQIKQEKATPEQWLKMIEKAGGLKVGEDKWMGLSDWLKEQDAKTLTKQEVLDYIKANEIRIEEVNYVAQLELEEEEQKQLDAMNEEFLTLREEARAAGEWIGDAGDIAYQMMVDKYGDDFTFGFGVDNGELYVSNLEAAASITGVEPRSEREINDTRLHYTTEGLDNKKEIALTVPTIDRWNQYDEIHFGDAGDGRVVVWVRFGEARTYAKEYADFYDFQGKMQKKYFPDRTIQALGGSDLDALSSEERDEFERLREIARSVPAKNRTNRRVLVIDEIQSKRHQEGREKGYKSDFNFTEREKDAISRLENMYARRAELVREKENNEDDELTRLAQIDFALDEVTNVREYDELNAEKDALIKKRRDRATEINDLRREIYKAEDELAILKVRYNYDYSVAIPDAPFEKNWSELAMKRMLRYAAENGYDAVAWTKGEQQAERYSLTKYFNGIAREDNPSVAGKRFQLYGGNVETIVVNNEGVVTDSTIEEAKNKPLSEVVGKEVAEKMMTIEDGDSLADEDIAVGGEGMKGFYDKMIPAYMNKYGKKWGVKVSDITLPHVEEAGRVMHSVPVTEAMKQSVMEGQPMFLKTPNGIVYGWTDGKKIYLTKDGMNPNTKIHEYTHIWAKAMMQKNPKGWNSIKQLLKKTPVWNEVMNDANYSNIHSNEDMVTSEVLSRISGTNNAAKLEQMAQQMIDEAKGTMRKAEARGLIQNIKDALNKFWNWVGTELFKIEKFESIDEITDRVLWDLVNKTDLGITEEKKSADSDRSGVLSGTTSSINLSLGGKQHLSSHHLAHQESDANLKTNFETIKRKVQKFINSGYEIEGKEKIKDETQLVQKLAKILGFEKSETSISYYGEYETSIDIDGKKYKVRLSNHKASGEWMSKGTFDERVSLVVEAKDSEGRDGGDKYFVEYVTDLKGNHTVDEVAQIITDSVLNLLSGKKVDRKLFDEYHKRNLEAKVAEIEAEMQSLKDAAIANGTFMTAPNGQPTNLNERQWLQVRTESFKDWFGDWENYPEDSSKIVDENGEPMVMYHGSAWQPLSEPLGNAVFKMNDGMLGKGAYFSSSLAEATGYAEIATDLDMTEGGNYEILQDEFVTDYFLNIRNEQDIYRGGDSMIVVAKSPSQIKSATDNVGTFDVDDADIRYRKSNAQNAAVDYLAGPQRNEVIERAVNEEAAKLDVSVTYVTREQMPKGHKNDKGYYNTSTGEIVICTENAASIADAIQTILHEAVAHKGLRQLMGDKFNEFINRVYDSLDAETKAKVDALAESKYDGNTAVAMEEYMASLAETENFSENSVWDKIKSVFENIINAILGRNDIKIGDNELRYILRASYNNMVNPRNMETIRGWARDQMMREDYKINHVAPELLSRTGIDPTQVATQTASLVYDKVVSDSWQEFQRQFQDAMQPVRIAIDAIQQETGNIPIEDYENYILIQNQSSSRSRVEIDDFARRYYSPIIEQVNKIIDTILESRGYDKNDRVKRSEVYKEVKTYLIAKHGLERNAYYQTRNTRKITAKTKAERIKSVREDHKDIVDQIKNDPTLSPSEKANLIRQEKKRRDTLINQIRDTDYELDVRDYSGLTALFGFRPEQYLDAEAEAERCVEQFENAVATDELWAKIKSATDKTLRHSYESGLLSRQQYNDIKNMFEFYIPLRGFDESTAEDVYAYARFEGNRFNPAVQKAEGRTSLADDPIAIIMNMAESEIAQGNKNRAKQALYNYLLNRSDGLEKQNSLMQIESVWAIKTVDAFGNEVYVIASPDHAAGETLEEFEERMQVMAEAGLAKKSQKGHVDVGMRFQKPSNKDAHYVYLKVNGVEKAIYINGNPKAADAINGTYAPMPSKTMQAVKDVQRLVSSTFTNYSLEFTARNYFRDMVYSHINISTRESDPAYRKKFRQNWRHNNMGAMLKMLTAYRAGELDGRPLTADEAAFVEFMNNGGQTGYTLINSVETHKKELERAIERMQKGIVKGVVKDTTIFRYTLGGIELLNEASELVTRFAAFKTSRDMGRGINRSISDAKEVTVNFNTKGAQDGTGWMGVVARYLGAVKYFFNASVQGVQNLGEAFQKNKLKFGTVVGSTIGLGMMMPILQGALSELIGGDEDEYWNIPEYDRQNNLCFVIGKGKYVKLPLPIGFREMYGLGDLMMAGILDKKFARSPLSVGMDVANKIATVVLPINPLEGSANGLSLIESGQDMLLPDFTQGMVQNRTNTDFKGVPIQKEYTYNENDPQWTKAFANNPAWLTGLSKWCYENIGIDGEGWDWSPEKLDNTFSNAFGGIYSLLKKTGRTVSAIWNEDNRTLSNVPLVGVIVGSNIDDDKRFVNSTYWEMDEYYNKRIYKIKSTAENFGLTLDEVFARNPEGERAGEHHPAMNKIYNKDYFDFMQEWYLGHKGEGETDENGEKILGLSQIKNKIKNLENKIKKNEDGVATPEQDAELVELNNSYEAARRDLVNDLLELD